MFTIRNYGNSRKLPYEGQFIEISKGKSIETEDLGLALALSEYPFIDLEWPTEKKNQLKFKRTQLVRWATKLGIPGAFFEDKNTLIGKISGVLT